MDRRARDGQRVDSSATTAAPSRERTAASTVHRLQRENEDLRYEYLRLKQRNEKLEQELRDARVELREAASKGREPVSQEVQLLQERCRLLAERLHSVMRDNQVTESSSVQFLLRSRVEENRFLRRGLQGMLSELSEDAAAVVDNAKDEEGNLHTGAIYRLIIAVSNAWQAHLAAAKLEKARSRLALEQGVSVMGELRTALEDVTRTLFDISSSLLADAGCDDDPLPVPQRCAYTSASTIRSCATPSLYYRRRAEASSLGAMNTAHHSVHRNDSSPPIEAASALASVSLVESSEVLAQNLEWTCDILKACMRGVSEVLSHISRATEELKAPSLLHRHCHGSRGREPLSRMLPSLTDLSVSPEMKDLLESFLQDLSNMKQRSAQEQDDMARQLAREVEHHFSTSVQYEQRIKMLEAECARLLKYSERVAADTTAAPEQAPLPKASPTGIPGGIASPDATENRRERSPFVTPERYRRTRETSLSSNSRVRYPAHSPRATRFTYSDAARAGDSSSSRRDVFHKYQGITRRMKDTTVSERSSPPSLHSIDGANRAFGGVERPQFSHFGDPNASKIARKYSKGILVSPTQTERSKLQPERRRSMSTKATDAPHYTFTQTVSSVSSTSVLESPPPSSLPQQRQGGQLFFTASSTLQDGAFSSSSPREVARLSPPPDKKNPPTMSQQLYDEAAAEFFSVDPIITEGPPSTPRSFAHGVNTTISSHATTPLQRLQFSPTRPQSPLSQPPSVHLHASAQGDSTPSIWHRIKEEARSRERFTSTAESILFGTPCSASSIE